MVSLPRLIPLSANFPACWSTTTSPSGCWLAAPPRVHAAQAIASQPYYSVPEICVEYIFRLVMSRSSSSTPTPAWLPRGVAELVCSGTGSAVGLATSHPFDTLKTRAQMGAQETVVSALRGILRTEGVPGLFRGMAAPVAATAGFTSVLFYINMTTRQTVAAIAPGLVQVPASGSQAMPVLTAPGYYIAGAAAGLISSFIQGPVDLAKTKLQAQSLRLHSQAPVAAGATGAAGGGHAAIAAATQPVYKGSLHAMVSIARHWGVRGLMQGQAATAARNTAATFFYFGSYEQVRALWARHARGWTGDGPMPKVPLHVTLGAGSVAGLAYWIGCYPLDVIKSRLQAQPCDPSQRAYSTMQHAYREVVHTRGLAGLWRGIMPCLARGVVCNALTFAVYDALLQATLGDAR